MIGILYFCAVSSSNRLYAMPASLDDHHDGRALVRRLRSHAALHGRARADHHRHIRSDRAVLISAARWPDPAGMARSQRPAKLPMVQPPNPVTVCLGSILPL